MRYSAVQCDREQCDTAIKEAIGRIQLEKTLGTGAGMVGRVYCAVHCSVVQCYCWKGVLRSSMQYNRIVYCVVQCSAVGVVGGAEIESTHSTLYSSGQCSVHWQLSHSL